MNQRFISRSISGLALVASVLWPLMAGAQTTAAAGPSLSGIGEAIIDVGLLAILLLYVLVLRKFGSSVLGLILRFFFFGTVALLFSRIFILLVDQSRVMIADGSREVWWHLIFYFSMLMFFYGARFLYQFAATGSSTVTKSTVNTWGVVTAGFIGLVFLLASMTKASLVGWYVGSPLDAFGLHHFIAVALAGTVAVYLYKVGPKIGLISRGLAMPIIVALGLLSLQHLWELLNESWQVIKVTDAVGERGEQVLVLLSLIFFVMSIMKLYRATATPKTPPVTSGQ